MYIWFYEQQLQSVTFFMVTDEQGITGNFKTSNSHQQNQPPNTNQTPYNF